MSAIIESTSRLTVRSGDDTLLDFGSVVAPLNPTTTPGTTIAQPKTITLEPGDSATLWSYESDGDLAFMEIKCSGFLWLAQKVDAPTSDTDPTASGTAINYPKEGLSCVGTHRIQGMAVPVAASSSNYAGSAFHASVANGRRYSIVVKNPADATDDVTVTYAWVQ